MVLVVCGVLAGIGLLGFHAGRVQCENEVHAETIRQNHKVQTVVGKNRRAALAASDSDNIDWLLQFRTRAN